MRPRLKPALLERLVVPKPWGGRALERVLGLDLGGASNVGETWELSDRPEHTSRLKGGGGLDQWMAEAREDLLGPGVPAAANDRFPLLIKFIDAREALSVQVHPDADLARAEGDGGKSEAWVVLDAGPRARVVRGLLPGTKPAEFARVAHTPEVMACLRAFTPRAGDVIDVPAGMVHAIGPDVVVYEIQQNSDVTYRLYDWGRDRPVHVEKALRAMRFDLDAGPTMAPVPHPEAGEWLVRNEFFTLRRLRLETPAILATEGTFRIATVIAGRATVGWHSGGADEPLLAMRGDTVLVPACAEAVFVSPIGALQLLWAGPGGAR